MKMQPSLDRALTHREILKGCKVRRRQKMKKQERGEDRKSKKKTLLSEQVYASIKGAIIGGEFEPGRRLIEETLAEDAERRVEPR